jgi:hypothetical protein
MMDISKLIIILFQFLFATLAQQDNSRTGGINNNGMPLYPQQQDATIYQTDGNLRSGTQRSQLDSSANQNVNPFGGSVIPQYGGTGQIQGGFNNGNADPFGRGGPQYPNYGGQFGAQNNYNNNFGYQNANGALQGGGE